MIRKGFLEVPITNLEKLMAEEEKKEEEKKEEKKGSSKLVLIIIGVLLFLIIAIGAVVAILLLGDDGSQQPAPQAQQTTGTQTQVRADEMRIGPMFPLDAFTVNLLSDSARRYLKVEMNLEMSTSGLQNELNQKMPMIRDTIISILGSKTVEEISTRRGKERLKDEIIEQVNMRLQDGHITRIYFMMFVIQ